MGSSFVSSICLLFLLHSNWPMLEVSQTILLLQPLCCRCAECVVNSWTECARKTTPMYVARTSNNRVILSGELYCCLLPQYEALFTCRLSFPIATKWCCDQDVKVVLCETLTERTYDRCNSLKKGGDVVATSLLALH